MLNRFINYFRKPESKAIVLMYHRVCDIATDPWQLAVSPHNFEKQIQTITKNFNVLLIGDLIEQFNENKIKANSIYITFDDAYQDNFIYAKPILEKYNCPATFFIPTDLIGKEQAFWWDELETIILHSKLLPKKLNLQIDKEIFNFQFDIEELTNDIKKKQQAWNWSTVPPTNRCKLYLEIWQLLKPLPYNRIIEVMERIKNWAYDVPPSSHESFPMNYKQLKSLTSNNLFTLGMHTQTHPALSSHSFEYQKNEIANSKKFIEHYNPANVNAIAYPYGNYNDDTLLCVKQNKIDLGFTTAAEVITQKSSPQKLGRLQVMDNNGFKLNEKLIKYLGK